MSVFGGEVWGGGGNVAYKNFGMIIIALYFVGAKFFIRGKGKTEIFYN